MKLTVVLLCIAGLARFANAAPAPVAHSSFQLQTIYHAKPRKVKKHKGVRHHV